MTRKRRTPRQRQAIFDRANGVCHLCEIEIKPGERWELEHKIALICGGTDDDENLAPAHYECHKPKTRQDRDIGAKCDRIRQKHSGAWESRTPMQGGKQSRWKKKMDGTVVER